MKLPHLRIFDLGIEKVRRPEIITIAAVIVAGIILALLVYFFSGRRGQETPAHVPATVTPVPVYELPRDFPARIPIEQHVTILNNFNAVSKVGRVQATRAFQSRKTIDENFTFYQTYMRDPSNGWTFEDTLVTATQRAIFAHHASGSVVVSITPDPNHETGSFVEISFVGNP